MSDLRPLRDEGATSFERELLDAVARERPSPEILASMQSALGVGATAAKVGTGGAASGFAGYATVAALAVGGAVIALVSLRGEPPAEPAAIARRLDRASPPVTPPVTAPVLPVLPSPDPKVVSVPAEPARARAPSKRAAAGDLRDEIRLLDEARSSLRSGSVERAVALLDRYGQRYPRGAFRQEVDVLRVEALERLGERRRASSLAREFLDQHPESPHSERVNRALDASAKPASNGLK